MKPKVSVIIPVYNSSRYVKTCLDSILSQSWSDFELLVSDDGSTDHSYDAMVSAAGNDPRVKLFRHSNLGMARTLNELLRVARGDYIARLDADDEALPQRLERQVNFMESNRDCVVVGGGVLNIDEDGDPFSIELYPVEHEDIESRMLSGRGGIIHPSTMIRRAPMVGCGGYSTNCPVVEDQDLWLRLALRGQLANIPEVLIRYRVHAGNISFSDARNAAQRLAEVLIRAHIDRGLAVPCSGHWTGAAVPDEWERRRQWCWSAVNANYHQTARKHAHRLVRQRIFDKRAWTLLAYAFFPRQANWLRQLLRRSP